MAVVDQAGGKQPPEQAPKTNNQMISGTTGFVHRSEGQSQQNEALNSIINDLLARAGSSLSTCLGPESAADKMPTTCGAHGSKCNPKTDRGDRRCTQSFEKGANKTSDDSRQTSHQPELQRIVASQSTAASCVASRHDKRRCHNRYRRGTDNINRYQQWEAAGAVLRRSAGTLLWRQ